MPRHAVELTNDPAENPVDGEPFEHVEKGLLSGRRMYRPACSKGVLPGRLHWIRSGSFEVVTTRGQFASPGIGAQPEDKNRDPRVVTFDKKGLSFFVAILRSYRS